MAPSLFLIMLNHFFTTVGASSNAKRHRRERGLLATVATLCSHNRNPGTVTLIFLTLLFLITSCSVTTHTLYDHRIDFSQYKTFCWMSGCEFTISGPTYMNDSSLRESVKETLIREMEARGFRYDNNDPDLVLDFHITMTNESSLVYHRDEDAPIHYQPLPEPEVIYYLKGTIIIDIADRREGRMVWRSEVVGYMDQHPDFTAKNLAHGVKVALKNFPPKKEEGQQATN